MFCFSLFTVLGDNFLKYMDAFKPFLFLALKNHAEYQVGVLCLCLLLPIVLQCIYTNN